MYTTLYLPGTTIRRITYFKDSSASIYNYTRNNITPRGRARSWLRLRIITAEYGGSAASKSAAARPCLLVAACYLLAGHDNVVTAAVVATLDA